MMVKIHFHLERNEDGYPPISVEAINATVIGDGLFRLDNTPFFVENVSYGDVIRATATSAEGVYEFEEVVEQSRFIALSIIILSECIDGFLMEFFRGMEAVIEYGEFGVYRILAVAIPDSVDYESVRGKLRDLEGRELLSFAELALL